MIPLHERIRSNIEAKILKGELVPGDRLPIEAELMQEYGCSRMTVNKALSALTLIGLIERRKRAGTFVARPRLHAMVLDVPDLAQEVARRGQSYGYRLLARTIRAPVKDRADEMTLAGRGKLIEVESLHLANGTPLALEQRLVSVTAVPTIIDADLEVEASGTWLLRHVPWTEAETRISAMGADGKISELLKIGNGDACLVIERRTWRGDEQITSVRQTFVADAYDLVARFGSGSPANRTVS
jgi:GntR family histidine utilization transcriptional repressor